MSTQEVFNVNVKDMDNVIDALDKVIDGAESFISGALYTAIDNAVTEWNGHMRESCNDADDMITELTDANETIAQLESVVAEQEQQLSHHDQEVQNLIDDIYRHLATITSLENQT